MGKNNQREKLIHKVRPYARLWENIRNHCSVLTKEKKNGTYSLLTLAIGENFSNLFDYLRFEQQANFIFIDGIGDNQTRIRGLLCIDENKQLATADDCFFVGDYNVLKNNYEAEKEQQIILSARQLNDLVGEDAKYFVCKVAILEATRAMDASIESFFRVLEKDKTNFFMEDNR